MSTPLTINSVETLQEALPLIRASQEAYSNFTQEQVDAICEKTAMAVSKMRIPLAKMACEETGYGIVVDKVTKNQYASEHIWNYMRNKKTCGIISEDRAFGVKKIASPKGVIAAITPTTNPTSTTIYKIMLALKTRNAIILSPHPHAVNCSIAAAKIMRDAAIEAGLPEHVISWISVPSLEISDVLMKSVDLIIATGGSGMVKAAYSSGINVRMYKTLAFVISAAYAGLAGGLYAHLINFISPDTFSSTQSTLFMTILLFGGMANLAGPLVGSVVLLSIKEFLQSFSTYQMMVYAILILIVLFLLPNGISGECKAIFRKLLAKYKRGKDNA